MAARAAQPLLSRKQVADRLGVSEKTVGRWIDRQELPAHRLGRQIRVSEHDLTGFLGARRR